MSLNTTPRTWVSGETVTAAYMNTEIRDALVGVQAAWTSYTPTLTNITKVGGVTTFRYRQVGKLVQVRGKFVSGASDSFAAGTLAFSLPPVTAHADYTTTADINAVGAAFIQPNGSATRWPGVVILNNTGAFQFYAASAANALVTNLVPGTFTASAAVISFTAEYEAA